MRMSADRGQPARGLTVREFARLDRVGEEEKVRRWIGGLLVPSTRRSTPLPPATHEITPEHLAQFETQRSCHADAQTGQAAAATKDNAGGFLP